MVGLQGTVQKYQDEMQLAVKYLASVEHIRALGGDVSGLDMALLLPQSPFDIGEMWDELLETVKPGDWARRSERSWSFPSSRNMKML